MIATVADAQTMASHSRIIIYLSLCPSARLCPLMRLIFHLYLLIKRGAEISKDTSHESCCIVSCPPLISNQHFSCALRAACVLRRPSLIAFPCNAPALHSPASASPLEIYVKLKFKKS